MRELIDQSEEEAVQPGAALEFDQEAFQKVARDGNDEGRMRWGPLLTLAVVFVVCDFLMVPIASLTKGPPEGWILVFALLGCTLAQGTTLAAWLVWSEWPLVRRLVAHWGIAAVLCCAWLLGFYLSGPDREGREVMATVVLAVPFVSLAAQLPLWIVRQLFGWRLVRGTGEVVAHERTRLTIRRLMVATLVVAASLAPARLVPPVARESERWLIWGVVVCVTFGTSTIAMLPAGALLLKTRQQSRAVWLGVAYIGLIVGTLWTVVLVQWRWWPQMLGPALFYVAICCLIISFGATVIGVSLVARGYGYRLEWGRRRLI